jgi:hypothetical protein
VRGQGDEILVAGPSKFWSLFQTEEQSGSYLVPRQSVQWAAQYYGPAATLPRAESPTPQWPFCESCVVVDGDYVVAQGFDPAARTAEQYYGMGASAFEATRRMLHEEPKIQY